MPKAAPGSRVSARLNTPGAEGVGEDGLLGGQTEGEAALEAVGELDGKFEAWHLQAKQDAAEAKAASAAGQAAVRAEIAGLTALVAKLNQPTEHVHGLARGDQGATRRKGYLLRSRRQNRRQNRVG